MDEESLQVELKTLTRKHIAERQRRARINLYLEEIQELTCSGTNKGQKVKLEKAEVLETALGYLQNNQEPEPNNNTIVSTDNHETQAYEEGFRSCMNGILDSFEEFGGFEEIVPGLKHHLESFLDESFTQWNSESSFEDSALESQMAFSPSLAKLEKCLQKFESGSVKGSDVMKGSDVVRGSDALSDISQSETGSSTETIPFQMAPTNNKEMNEYHNNPELVSGYTVNEWVNMQREYVIHQQMVFQQQQQQQHQQQQYQQFYNQHHNQHQYQTYPFHVQTQNSGAEDLTVTNTVVSKQNVVNKNKQVTVSRNKDVLVKQEDKSQVVEQKNDIKLQVWRPW